MMHHLGAAMGVAALLAVSGCGNAVVGAPTPGPRSSSETADSTGKAEEAGVDECGLVEPDEVAKAIGVEAMYVTGRTVRMSSDGSRHAACVYFPEDVPGMLGMQLSTVADTDPERFFEPFAKNFQNIETIPNLGDRAEAVAYGANGTSTHFVEVRTIVGDTGLHLYYAYKDGGGVMPKADGAAAAVILTTALERLPDEVTIPDGTPEGGCADIDLESAAEAVGAELEMARSVVSDEDAMSCYFSGGDANLDITLLTDPSRAQDATVTPDEITHADIGDGARLLYTEAETLDARVNLGGQVVAITASYEDAGTVTTLRPADVELVRNVVEAISEGN